MEAMRGDMTKVGVRNRPVKTHLFHGAKKGSIGVWFRLPASIVEARAGLIPSGETDGNPPPEGLTVRESQAWHRGLPVYLSASRFVKCLETAKLRAWRQAPPIILNVVPTRSRAGRSRRTR
jgi:hypothetical protein